MNIQRHTVLRDWIALVLILVVVPLSVFGGTNVACVGQGITETCAPQEVFFSPLLLMVAGVIAGLITSGWTGLLVVGFGQIAGQVVIVALAGLAGRLGADRPVHRDRSPRSGSASRSPSDTASPA